MKLGVLGTDPDLLRLLAAAIDDGHEIVWLGDVRPEEAENVSSLLPPLTDRSSEWELLLDRATADGVLIGRGTAVSELRAEQLKRLAAEAMPLLIVHPIITSVLAYYEVDMARREAGGIVRHYNPPAGHPVFEDLATWARSGHPAIGAVHQVTCDRRVVDTSRETVLAQLSRDAELLAIVAGDMRRVSAIGPARDAGSFASLQIQMTCGVVASARWSISSPAGSSDDLIVALIGEDGIVTLRMSEDAGEATEAGWELDVKTAAHTERLMLESHDAARIAVRQFADAIVPRGADRRAASTWDVATRAMEVVDAVELSLEKSRTVDVHQQQLTERLAFRGTMSAIGCGLLLIGFFALVVVTVVGGAENEGRRQLINSWPLVLLALLAGFLLLQFVPLLIAKRRPAEDTSGDRPQGDRTG
jgi:predicted dehydrogenase